MDVYLTEREKNVLFYLVKGYTNEEIAKVLHISVHTVKAHLEAIYEELRVGNRVQAAMKAVSLELVGLETFVK